MLRGRIPRGNKSSLSNAALMGLALAAFCGFNRLSLMPAVAQTVPGLQPPSQPRTQNAPGFWTRLFGASRTNLLGDMGGFRSQLGNYGISLGLQETSEVFGNVTGGKHRGADYDGVTEVSVALDTAKAFGWEGGTFNLNALQIHGRSITADNLGTLQFTSSLEADRATRLWELWYRQAFLGGLVDVKVGQQSIDQEFIITQYGSTFINSALGWPVVGEADLYAGSSAYPLSSLGVRVRVHPTNNLSVLAGVFDDNPGGGPFRVDAQLLDASGTKFNLNTGALWIAEVQYAVNQPSLGDPSHANQQTGLPGMYKLGFWYDSGHFPDQQFDTLGRSLADPASSGVARLHRGNYSVYAIMDQLVWRPNATSARGMGVFARVVGAPEGDRNRVTMGANAGVVLKDPLPHRDNDAFGVGFGLAKISNRASALDKNAALFRQNSGFPIRTNEVFVEVTYQYQVAPWWQVQPDFQYVFNPGGGILNPLNPTRRIGDEAIFGLRTVIVF